MKRILLLILAMLPALALAAPLYWLKWDNTGTNSTVSGVVSINEGSDSSCSADVFIDRIESFKHIPSSGNIEIITHNSHSEDGLFIYKQSLSNMDFTDIGYLSSFLKTKEKVVFIGERCGVSGKYFSIDSMLKLDAIK